MAEGHNIRVYVNAGAGSVDDFESLKADMHTAFAAADESVHVEVRAVEPQQMGAEIRRCWEREKPDTIVVAGGDGTVNIAANAAAGTEMVIGVLPLGTFNHFARDIGMPTALDEAAAAIVQGEVHKVDVGEVNGRVFVNNSLLGVYPEMVATRDEIMDDRGWGKIRSVPIAAMRALRSFPVHRVDLFGDQGVVRRRLRTPFVFIGNGRYDNAEGGAMVRGSMNDATLGVEVARTVTRWALVRAAIKALWTGVEATGEVDRVDTTELLLSSHTKSLQVAVDGEVIELRSPLRYRVRPEALRVRAPRAALTAAVTSE